MRAYYNEIDPFAAEWLRQLIADGLIPAGDVDERDIRDVLPSDLDDFHQCHFFAGIGGWALALQLAGWPDDRPVWTGSCPCQPFSAAGRGGGFADERHLWPAFFHLIDQCHPATIFGEQVASKDGLGWLDLVHADLEGAGYAVGAADLCAAGVGAPHIRQRLWWVADAGGWRCDGWSKAAWRWPRPDAGIADGCAGIVALAEHGRERRHSQWRGSGAALSSGKKFGELGDAASERRGEARSAVLRSAAAKMPASAGHWRDLEWLPCRDGKARPTQPGLQPLAHGVLNRVGTLRGAGNAIVSQVAALFISSCM